DAACILRGVGQVFRSAFISIYPHRDDIGAALYWRERRGHLIKFEVGGAFDTVFVESVSRKFYLTIAIVRPRNARKGKGSASVCIEFYGCAPPPLGQTFGSIDSRFRHRGFFRRLRRVGDQFAVAEKVQVINITLHPSAVGQGILST